MIKLILLVGDSVTFQAWGSKVIRFPEDGHRYPRDQVDIVWEILSSGKDAVVQTTSEIVVLSALKLHVTGQAVVELWVSPPLSPVEYRALNHPVRVPLDDSGRPTTPILEQFFAPVGDLRRSLIEARRGK